jgi:hypothetical protein
MSTNKASIFYDIVTEYNDKGAKAAQKSFGGMDKGLAALGKKLTGVFSAAAVEEFARRSVQAFAKEDAALKVLGQTLGNIGLGFKTVEVSSFITKLAESTGVMKETLFPAFETLIRYTGDVGKAQDLLNLSLDVSAGTGKDTAAVALALGKAYGGNTVALGRLGAGLTKAELSSKNFALVQSRLATLFKGDASTAADSFQGKINRLKVAFTEMQVQVGEGLASALTTLGGNDGIQNLIDGMDRFGTSIKDASIGLSDLIGQLSKLPGMGLLGNIGKILSKNVLFDYLQSHGKKIQADAISNDTYTQQKRTLVAQNAITTQQLKQVSAAKTALQLAKDKAALDKANAALKLADSVFDLQKIEIMAALARGQNQADTDRLNLQLLILNATNLTGDALTKAADNATILSEKILMANGLVMLADGSIQNLKDAKNPFAGFDKYVQDVLNGILAIQKALDALKAPSILTATSTATNVNGASSKAWSPLSGLQTTVADQIAAGITTNAQQYNPLSGLKSTTADISAAQAYNPLSGMTVQVTLDSATIAAAVNTQNVNTTLGGTQLATQRINTPWLP